MAKNENKFQAELIKEIEGTFDGCIVLKNDANYKQGFPDLTIFYKNKWAVLECKKDDKSSHRPNQDYYVNKCDGMSYARFVSPNNKEEVMNELKVHFQ